MDDRQHRSPVRVRAGRVCTLRTPSVPAPFYVALVGVTGVTVPAVTTFVRSSLPALIADAGERASAYALLAVLFQAAVATGPLLVSCTLLVAGPMTAILGAPGAVLVATGACLLAAGGLRTPRRAPSARAGGRARLSAGLRTVVSVGACVGIATGLNPASQSVRRVSATPGHYVLHGDYGRPGAVAGRERPGLSTLPRPSRRGTVPL